MKFHPLSLWLRSKITGYQRVNPTFLSTAVMISAAATSALLAVGYAKLVDAATELMGRLASDHKILFLAIAPLSFAVAWAIVYFMAPTSSGSGIPQVMAAIESVGRRTDGGPLPSLRSKLCLLAAKVCSSLAALIGGAALGREGPTIHLAATAFDLFDDVTGRFLSGRRNRETLLIAGGAAGLAAAFNTPLGGIVFAIEELAQNHFKTFKGGLILAVITAGYVTQALLGPYLFVGHPTIGGVTLLDALLGVGAAIPIGAAGAAFGILLFVIMARVNRLGWRGRLCLALGVGAVMSGVACLLGPDASGGGSLLIKKLLFHDATDVSWTLAMWRIFGVLVTYASGCAGGIFSPALTAGAVLGAKIAAVAGAANPSVVIVLGMIAFLTGMSHSPFTSFILVFEMTDRQAAVLPMMAAALLANAVSRWLDEHSFYEKMRDVLLTRSQGTRATLSLAAMKPSAPDSDQASP